MPDLYRMYTGTGLLLYIGVSINAGARAAQHAATKPWWNEVERITVHHYTCSWPTILNYERRAILEEKPRHNIQHNNTDTYVEHLDVVPYDIPYDVTDTPEWAALQRALIDLRHANWRRYGTRTLSEHAQYTYHGDNGYQRNIDIDFLHLIDATARAAHLTTPCPQCAIELAPTILRIKSRPNEETTIDVLAECRHCYRDARRTVTWEDA